MLIKDQPSLQSFNERFGYFHDGFIKRIDVVSGSKFQTHCPWEPAPDPASGSERLQGAGWAMYGGLLVRLVVAHFNYDWPNQPFDREIWITARVTSFAPELVARVGTGIFDLRASYEEGGMRMDLSWHELAEMPSEGPWSCSLENAHRLLLWTADRFRVVERRQGLREATP